MRLTWNISPIVQQYKNLDPVIHITVKYCLNLKRLWPGLVYFVHFWLSHFMGQQNWSEKSSYIRLLLTSEHWYDSSWVQSTHPGVWKTISSRFPTVSTWHRGGRIHHPEFGDWQRTCWDQAFRTGGHYSLSEKIYAKYYTMQS